MVATSETKMVTGKINGQDVTVPAGTSILDAARSVGIDVPNLCFQPLMRAWGSCRICTVETLGKRGGMVESCAAQFTDGIEVLTHSDEALKGRQYILQMYLIDHALDCPTCDKSGECYLQDNTYLHNINANPYRRPKMATPYEHFSPTIDYKWDRCIMCNRCTRVCDEMIGAIAIESTNRGLDATIAPSFGVDMAQEGTCVNCGMCVAVCPVGALTDRHFGHHPWELDTTETICGFCDVGCTLNIDSNKGIVRRTTNLWERGVNLGYVCDRGKWGHEQIQSPDRLFFPRTRGTGAAVYETAWDDAIDQVAAGLEQYKGGAFAALASGENTNEEAFMLQKFTREVMRSNNVDRLMSRNAAAVERATRESLGYSVSATNAMDDLRSAVKNILVVGPSIYEHAPVASYWINHSLIYRESNVVVVSTERYPLCDRSALWLKPNPNTTSKVLEAIASEIQRLGLATENGAAVVDLASVERITGVPAGRITEAASLFVAGTHEAPSEKPEKGFPPAAIFHTVAAAEPVDHVMPFRTMGSKPQDYEDAAEIAAACANLSILTGNIGRAGGGVASLRGAANFQGVTDMGMTPYAAAGGQPTQQPGVSFDQLPSAIASGQIKAMIVEGGFATRKIVANRELFDALSKLEFLVVIDAFESPLAGIADIVLPLALNLEKDGTFTNFDRTVQRVRAAVPAIGEAKPVTEIVGKIARRMGSDVQDVHPSRVMSEIAKTVPAYAGVTYARLERGGVQTPVASMADPGTRTLGPNSTIRPLQPKMIHPMTVATAVQE